jgi:hypothetical protein
MQPATAILVRALLRQAKGALTAFEKWIDEVAPDKKEIPVLTDRRTNAHQEITQ